MIMRFLEYWKEWPQLGYNAVTIGLIGTVVFTFLEIWGMWEQNATIWRQKSGLSVPVTWMCNSTGLFAAALAYGLASHSFALFFNGVLLFFHFPILVGLWKFKGFTYKERAFACLFLILCLAAAILPISDWIFLFFLIGGLGFSVLAPYEIWRNKNSGAVEIKLLVTILFCQIFWTVYAFAISDWVLRLTAPAFFVTFSLTIFLWFKYRQPKVI